MRVIALSAERRSRQSLVRRDLTVFMLSVDVNR
ncbi:hypothetical protein HDA32_004332 [Spinactinospora alkalitolerans]|uniref:Uncharacterized protein n=1 Tax=Spinactinospora alkalitolerans TaxID=687207 RepID=A0A852U1J0_9ACTN|nr:hypothetical protein [Spinactinospora alkalitolerans]